MKVSVRHIILLCLALGGIFPLKASGNALPDSIGSVRAVGEDSVVASVPDSARDGRETAGKKDSISAPVPKAARAGHKRDSLKVAAEKPRQASDELESETYYEELPEVVITAKHRPKGWKERRAWRKQARLVYNFNRVYPFALTGRKLMNQVDSTIEADHLDKRVRDQYIKEVEKELLRLYEADIRNTTISQGFLLTRLVDRECRSSVYDIIKDYEGGFAAGFWNLVGKIFDQDLKAHYDPEGKDKDTEKLVQIWESGDWDEFYYGVFGEYPQKTVIVADHLDITIPEKQASSRAGHVPLTGFPISRY